MNESPAEAKWRQVLSGLREKIDPVPVGFGYRIGLILVAILMILLPLIYIGLIVLAGYGVYWYAVTAGSMFSAVGARGSSRGGGRVGLLLLVAYLGPLIAGAILVFFMIKPLFARRTVTHFPLSLNRRDEPLLFAFVERLCEVVGAPKPSRIDVDTQVNASASFREGWWGFVRKDLVLTIGLPLAAGMELRQLTGVLAHEFGHFAQGTGMRVTYLIRTINGWFARIVFERDSWDEWLAAAAADCGHWSIGLVVLLAQIFVWMTRQILKLLMYIGHGVSSFMLRQMEFDADRYETRVSGSDTFARTTERLETIGIASQAAFNELSSAWRERRLCDDLPSLIVSRQGDLPKEIRQAIAKHHAEGKTGWFDTHPAHSDRIRCAKRENARGIFSLDLPATVLFSDFAELSRRATVAFYHETLGGEVKREHLVPTDSMVTARGQQKERYNALGRYFQGLVHPIRAVFPSGTIARPKDDDTAAEMLLDLRTRLTEALPAARQAAEQYEQADDRLIAVARARILRGASERPDLKELKLTRGDEGELIATIQSANRSKAAGEHVLNDVLADSVARLELALSMEPKADPRAAPRSAGRHGAAAEEPSDEYALAEEPADGADDRLKKSLAALRGAWGSVELLRHEFYLLATLLGRLPDGGSPSQPLVEALLAKSEKVTRILSRLHADLLREPYPYEHSEKGASIARFLIAQIPTPQEVGGVYQVAESALDGAYGLYMRIMSDLSLRAETVESSLGLPPLPEVEEKKDEETQKAE